MNNPQEQHPGREILFASASGLLDRYHNDEEYRLVKMKKYALGIEARDVPLAPSTLTADLVRKDWGRRLIATIDTVNTLPSTAFSYLTDAKLVIISLMSVVEMMKFMQGVHPWNAMAETKRKFELDDYSFLSFREFTWPIHPDLKADTSDDQQIELLMRATASYRRTAPDFFGQAVESEGVMYQTYQALYPLAGDYLSHRSSYDSKRIVLPKRWF